MTTMKYRYYCNKCKKFHENSNIKPYSTIFHKHKKYINNEDDNNE